MNIQNIINNFHFLRAEYLWLLSIVLILVLVKRVLLKISQSLPSYNQYNSWGNICTPDILSFLYKKTTPKSKLSSNILNYIVLILMIIALAGPTWSKKEIPLYQNQNSWIIALSLSQSMEKTDLSPSRVQRAKYKIKDFISYLQDEQLGLIVFTSDAYEVIPLTTDKKTILHILPSLDPLIMPEKGNDINSALLKAKELINNLNLKSSNILLLTDSDANSQSLLTAQELNSNNIAIYSINFNTAVNTMNNSLEELSKLSNGLFYNITNDDADLTNIINHAKFKYNSLYDKNNQLEKSEAWHDMGPWVLLLILPLLFYWLFMLKNQQTILNKLTSYLLSISLSLLITSLPNQKTYANTGNTDGWKNLWENLWYNQQQIAADNLVKNNNTANIQPEIFHNSKWQAAAAYKNNNYNLSENLLKSKSDLTSRYNMANSLAKQGKIKEAIEEYNKILQKNPKHYDAKFNKELLEKYQQEQQNNQAQENNQNQKTQEQQEKPSANQGQQEQQNNTQQQASQNNQNQFNKSEKTKKEAEEKNQEKNQQAKIKSQPNKSEQELDKWLDKIPDNPANYLRNQLQYEYWKKRQSNDF